MKKWMTACLLVAVLAACHSSGKKAETKTAEKTVLDDLEQQVKRNPDSANIRLQLINTLDSLHQYDQAIAHTDSLLHKDSLNNELWVTKGQLQESNKDTAGAISSYLAAVNIYPSVESQLDLANLLAEARNPKALLFCNNVRNMSQGRETDANCDFIAGIYYARIGNGKQAVQLYDRAINGNYTLMEAYMEKGFVYYDSKDYAAALKVFETATTVNNLYADAWYWKGKCYEAMGKKQEAIDSYERSLTFDKQLKEATEAIRRLKA